MENKEIEITSLLKLIWASRKKVFLWGGVGLAFGIVVAFSIPKEWTSEIKLVTENKQQSTSGSLGGLASMMGVGSIGSSEGGINETVYPVVLESSVFLQEFMDINVPYKGGAIRLTDYLIREQKQPWWSYVLSAPALLVNLFSADTPAQKPTETVVDPQNPPSEVRAFEGALKSRLSIEKDKKTNVYDIKVKMQDPVVAAIVADSVLVKLERYMKQYFTSKAREDLVSNEKLLTQAQQKYYQADSELARAQDQNMNITSKVASLKLDRLLNEKNIAFAVYQQLASQVEMNRIKVQEATPIATVIEPARVADAATSPNKKLICIALTFLGMVLCMVQIIVRELLDNRQEEA